MNYNKLRYFYEVCKTLNLTRAAQNLFITQPALSRHISDLEGEFGVALFYRTNRNLILTPAGKALRDECDTMFAGEQTLLDRVRHAAEEKSQHLSVAFMGINAGYRIPDLLSAFRREHPTVETSSERLNWSRVYESVEGGSSDAGIKLTSGERYPDSMAALTLQRARVTALLPTGHPCAGRGRICLSELKDDPFLFLTPDESAIPYQHSIQQCRAAGFEPKITACYSNVETLLMMVRAGAGVALLSPLAPLSGLSDLVCVPFDQAREVTLDLIWRKQNPNPALPAFLEFCRGFAW